MSDKKWLTRTQVQERLGVCETTVRQWCAKGLLEERRVSRRAYVSAASVERLEGHPVTARGARRALAPQGLLTLHEAREALGISYAHAYRYTTQGRLERHQMPGDVVYVTAASVERLKALRAAQGAVDAARERVAGLAATGDGLALLEATAVLAQARADLLVLEKGV